jgi:DNA-binding CsgD family transcriptional regulator/PAS domain-containing protein
MSVRKRHSGAALSTRLGAIFDAVLEAESVPRFVATLTPILDELGLELVVRGNEPDGTGYERPASLLEYADIELDEVPSPLDSDPRGPLVLGSLRGIGGVRSDLVLRYLRTGRRPETGEVVLGELAWHLLRAFRLHRALVGGQVRGFATALVLDALPFGVILVNMTGRVLQANRFGDEILAAADGLAREGAGLRAGTNADTERLNHVIAQVAGSIGESGTTPVGVLSLERPSLSPPWLVVVVPVHARRRADTVTEIAALFVTEAAGGNPTGIPPEAVARLFGLTPAEARLMVALIDGLTLDEAADRFEVSKNTLRNQLNQIFRKTGVGKQSELVRMILSSPAPILSRPHIREGEGEDD